jgi:predicted N-acyltransferase
MFGREWLCHRRDWLDALPCFHPIGGQGLGICTGEFALLQWHDGDNVVLYLLRFVSVTLQYHPQLYVKSHSMGEFIFDSNWADAAAGNGIAYYPKLLVGVPFTPVTGDRILLNPKLRRTLNLRQLASLRRLVSFFLKKLVDDNNLSSVHLNFATEGEITDIAGAIRTDQVVDMGGPPLDGSVKAAAIRKKSHSTSNGFLRRTSIQYLWTNSNTRNQGRPYVSFEEYLSCFKSKRRISVKRERRKVMEDGGIRIDAVVGREILKHDGLVERMFDLYLSTVQKFRRGRQYLTSDFFRLLAQSSFVDNLCFLCARRTSSGEHFKAKDVIAGTFNCVNQGVFYGRYWGCMEEVKHLHFETCYWSAIEYCIREGLSRMEPGAGGEVSDVLILQDLFVNLFLRRYELHLCVSAIANCWLQDYKWARGFDPAFVHSAHYIQHPGLRQAVCQFINYETTGNLELQKFLVQHSVVGGGDKGREETNG